MKNEFVPYDVALAMKELEFDEPCVAVYYGDYDERDFENGIALEYRESQYYAQKGWLSGLLAPTFSQAFRWFREKGYETVKKPFYDSLEDLTTYVCDAIRLSDGRVFKTERKNTYEEAELACLRKLIEIVNQNKDE